MKRPHPLAVVVLVVLVVLLHVHLHVAVLLQGCGTTLPVCSLNDHNFTILAVCL